VPSAIGAAVAHQVSVVVIGLKQQAGNTGLPAQEDVDAVGARQPAPVHGIHVPLVALFEQQAVGHDGRVGQYALPPAAGVAKVGSGQFHLGIQPHIVCGKDRVEAERGKHAQRQPTSNYGVHYRSRYDWAGRKRPFLHSIYRTFVRWSGRWHT
jgi:hypothetical protein